MTRLAPPPQVLLYALYSPVRGELAGAVAAVASRATATAVLALREIEDRDSKLVLFTGIREARFRKPVVPGDTLTGLITEAGILPPSDAGAEGRRRYGLTVGADE